MARNRRRGGRPPTIDLNAREMEGEMPEGTAGDRPEIAPGAQEGTPTFTTEEGARESHDEAALDQPAPAPYSQPGAGEPGTDAPAMHTPPQDTEPATGETQEERAGIASSLDMSDGPQGRPGGPGEDEPPVEEPPAVEEPVREPGETPAVDEPPRDGDGATPPATGRRGPGFGSLLLSALLGGALGAGLLYWLLAAEVLPRGEDPAVAVLQGEVETLRGELAAREPAVSPAEIQALAERLEALSATPPAELSALRSELESVRGQLAEAPAGSGEAAALNERLSALESRIDATLQDFAARLQAAPGGVDPELAERLSALETRIAQTGAPDAELRARVEGLTTALAGVEELARNSGAVTPQALEALGTDLAGRIDAVQTRLDSIDQTTQALQQQVASGAEQRAAIEQNLTQSVDELRQTVSSLQSEVGAAAQAREALGGELESLRSTTSALQGTAETLQSDLSGLTGTVEGVQQRLAELDALAGRIDAIDRQIAALDARTSQAEQERQAALALALQGLGRAAEGDAPFAREVETVAALVGDDSAVAELREYAEAGVPSRPALAREFDAVARNILAADGEAGDGFLSRLGANAQSLVRVRRTGEAQGTGADAIVARMEARLEEGDLAGALQEWSGLSEEARQASAEWAAAAERRLALDQAIAALGRPDAPPAEPTTRTVPVDVPPDGAAATPTN